MNTRDRMRDILAGMREAAAYTRGELALPVRIVPNNPDDTHSPAPGNADERRLDGEGSRPQKA